MFEWGQSKLKLRLFCPKYNNFFLELLGNYSLLSVFQICLKIYLFSYSKQLLFCNSYFSADKESLCAKQVGHPIDTLSLVLGDHSHALDDKFDLNISRFSFIFSIDQIG